MGVIVQFDNVVCMIFYRLPISKFTNFIEKCRRNSPARHEKKKIGHKNSLVSGNQTNATGLPNPIPIRSTSIERIEWFSISQLLSKRRKRRRVGGWVGGVARCELTMSKVSNDMWLALIVCVKLSGKGSMTSCTAYTRSISLLPTWLAFYSQQCSFFFLFWFFYSFF